MGHDKQTRAVETLRDLWRMRLAQTLDKATQRTAAEDGGSFGRRLVEIINDYAANPDAGPEICEQVTIWRGFPHAQISYADRVEQYQMRFKVGERTRTLAPDPTRTSVIATIPRHTLARLGAFVAESRRQADKLGIEIEEDSTWAALGDEQPSATDKTPPAAPSGAAPTNENGAPGRAPSVRSRVRKKVRPQPPVGDFMRLTEGRQVSPERLGRGHLPHDGASA